MGKFQSSKLFDGYSTVFRQWKADTTHCKYLHGYAISFRVWFEGELDEWGLDLPVDLSVQEVLEAEEDDYEVPGSWWNPPRGFTASGSSAG